MAPPCLVPLGDSGGSLHLLDDLAEANACVVGAERDFSHLRAVRNDAHFGAPKVVIEEILKPHASHEQEAPLELVCVPFTLADLGAIGADLAQKLARELG